MKTLNLAFTLLLLATIVPGANAQDTVLPTTTGETSTNQILLDNAAKARAAEEAKNAGKPETQMRTMDGSKPAVDAANLTDQEKQLSQNYIHQGKANAIVQANCQGDMQTVCNGNEGNHKFLGMNPNMIKAVAQAYAMFGAIAGDSLGGISKSEGAVAKETEELKKTGSTEKVDTKVSDYCKYIPTATEGIATAVQMAKTKELAADEVGNGDTAQKDALLKAAKSHDSRAKMAQIQAAGWWGGAACYAVNVARPDGWAMDKNLAIKAGAATLLGAFYQSEVSANKEYADKTRNIANQLPGKGDCNPITDNLCYCSQPSTENDPTYCAAGLHKKAIAATSYRIACTTNDLKLDPSCTCEKSNTCFETMLEVQGQGTLNLGSGYATSPFNSIRSLARGELVGGTLNSKSYDATSAIAKKGIQEISKHLPNDYTLTKDQKGIADAMVEKGLPRNLASLMASNSPGQAAINAAMAKFSGASAGSQLAAIAPKGSNIVDFSGGNGLGYKGNSGNDKGTGAEDILAKLKPGAKNLPNSKVLEFAQKAEAQARQNGQIRKESTPLFEIISMRYQTSGRRLLEVEPSK